MTHYDEYLPNAARLWESHKLSGEYARVAEGLGAHAERVETPAQIAPAIRNGLAANRTGQPAVLEIITKAEEAIARYR